MRPKKLDFENYNFEEDNQELILTLLEDYFYDEGNPLYAWEAYAFCRKYKRAMPSWILGYFEQVAKELMELAEKKFSNQRASALVYNALGMKRVHSRNVFDRYQIARRDREIWGRVCTLTRGRSRIKLEDAFDKVLSEMSSEGMEIPCDLAAAKKAYYSLEKEAHKFEVSDRPRRGPKRKRRR
ncbi:MAG TPA: hypothetical protein VEK32_22345 [Thermodesulfobacteriota bacterium]|nr:hypothetical protein [Thermodesulfobacteriota bacterium]